MRCYRVFIVLVLVAGLFGCQTLGKQAAVPEIFVGDPLQAAKPWTDKDFQNDPDRFQFAVISDLHGSEFQGIFEEAVKRIDLMQPEFVVCVGDLIAGYTEDEAEITSQREEFEKLIDPLNMRFFYLPGNHDITNMTMSKVWQERYGTTYYHFVYRNVLFLCLNTEDPPDSHISQTQVQYIKATLEQNPDVRWTMVLMHKPMWMDNPKEWEPVETLLADRQHTIFAGHVHVYEKMVKSGHKYVRLAVTGGGSNLRGPGYGEFNQIAWVTMTENGPKIANLDLNGIMDEDLSTEPLAMIEAMAVRSWFAADSIVCEPKKFEKGNAVLNFSNPGSLPLAVQCVFKPHDQLSVSEQNIDLTLPPRSKKDMVVEVHSKKPLVLADVDPLVYEISAVYTTPEGSPMKSGKTQALDIRYPWQGPEMVKNSSFDQGMENWIMLKKTPESAELSVEDETVKIHVLQKDYRYALVLAQTIGKVEKDTDYQLNIKAKSLDGPNKIGVGIRDGNDYTPMLIGGKAEPRHLISLTDAMERHEIDFRISKETDVSAGILVFTFFTENEVVVDEVSLRAVNKSLMAKKRP